MRVRMYVRMCVVRERLEANMNNSDVQFNNKKLMMMNIIMFSNIVNIKYIK